MGIVTSKVRMTSLMGLKLCGLSEFFQTIVSVDDVQKAKPDPEGIRKAMQALGSSTEHTLMVGDSHYDIEAAHNAGVQSAGVAWSMKGIEYLKSYKPTYIIDDIRELLPLVGLEG